MTKEEFEYAKEQIKTLITNNQIVEYYTGSKQEKGRYKCPFNKEEKHSNLKVGDRGWFCFSCGIGGDEIMFVQKLLDLSVYDAVERICVDFGISIDIDSYNRARLIAERERREKQSQKDLLFSNAIKEAENVIINTILDKILVCKRMNKILEPSSKLINFE